MTQYFEDEKCDEDRSDLRTVFLFFRHVSFLRAFCFFLVSRLIAPDKRCWVNPRVCAVVVLPKSEPKIGQVFHLVGEQEQRFEISRNKNHNNLHERTPFSLTCNDHPAILKWRVADKYLCSGSMVFYWLAVQTLFGANILVL